LFEGEDFAVDERSREFQALNPSTKIDTTSGRVANEIADSSDSEDSDEDEIMSKPKPKPEMRISSSSYKKSGHQRRDKPLGARTQGTGRISKNKGEVVGERSVTFAPSGKKDKERAKPTERKGRRDDGRRSASGNVFRRM
jgi:ribosome biogenesis protein ENP2